jgi:glycerol-1-phosphate dehydrogenase [NAD(P)+]
MNYLEKALKKTTDTKALIIEEGAMKRAPEMFRSLFGNQKAIVVADTNTWKAGRTICAKISGRGWHCYRKAFHF